MFLILPIQKETLHVGCYFSFVHCLFRTGGGKTSLKPRCEHSLKVTSEKTVRPRSGSTPRAVRAPGALTKRATGREFGVRSHGAGLLQAEASGERRLGNDGCSGPAAPSPEPRDQHHHHPPPYKHTHTHTPVRPPLPGGLPPLPRQRSPRRRARPAPQPTRCPRPRPSLAPPVSPVPGANQTNNASPAALLPLPADRLASSHLGRSRSEPRLPAGG